MDDEKPNRFDCVESMREARARLSEEIADMNYSELVHWLRTTEYPDPFLRQLAQRAAEQVSEVNAAGRR